MIAVQKQVVFKQSLENGIFPKENRENALKQSPYLQGKNLEKGDHTDETYEKGS